MFLLVDVLSAAFALVSTATSLVKMNGFHSVSFSAETMAVKPVRRIYFFDTFFFFFLLFILSNLYLKIHCISDFFCYYICMLK